MMFAEANLNEPSSVTGRSARGLVEDSLQFARRILFHLPKGPVFGYRPAKSWDPVVPAMTGPLRPCPYRPGLRSLSSLSRRAPLSGVSRLACSSRPSERAPAGFGAFVPFAGPRARCLRSGRCALDVVETSWNRSSSVVGRNLGRNLRSPIRCISASLLPLWFYVAISGRKN